MTFDTSQQITCNLYRNNANNHVTAPVPGCPGWSNVTQVGANTYKYFNNEGGDTGSMWGVAQGQNWNFILPVKVQQPLSGAPLQMHLTTADGNSNGTRLIEVPVYVFANGGAGQPSGVMYQQPATIDQAGAKYGIESNYQAVVNHKTGVAKFEIGTDPALTSLIGTHQFAWNTTAYSAINVGTGWDSTEAGSVSTLPNLQPGVTYYWRGVVTLTGQAPMSGAIQSFRLKPGGGVDTAGGLVPGQPSNPGAPGGGGDVGGGILLPVPVPAPTPPGAPQPGTPSQPGVTPLAATLSAPAKASARKAIKVKVTCSSACASTV